MYKVIIIDDEPIIVQGLTRSVPWEAYGCQVVDTASNGAQGREKIETRRPDIVFLDICMPEMDGLTMLAGLRSEFPDLQITVLTGFRDFDFAQQAIRLGVSRFLLKPSSMSEIEEAIRFMTDELRRRGSLGDGEETEEESQASHEAVANSFIVKNAMDYIEAHYSEKLMLTDVAEKIYVSQWHLSKLLNRETGQSFSELLNGVRIRVATELMRDPALRISDISEQVGFLDVAHFSRVFKKITGMSAGEYRNHRLMETQE